MKEMILSATTLIMFSGLSLAIAGNIDNGKALFESPTLGGGTSGKSCKSCHKGGRNIGADLFGRKEYTIMGTKTNDVAGIVNFCIEKPLKGSAIDPNGKEMLDLLSYIKTLIAK